MTTRKSGVAILPRLRRPPVLGRAGLVVEQHRRPGDRGEHLLRLVEAGAVPHVDALGELVGVVPVEVVGGHDHLADTLEQHHLHDVGHADRTDGVLAAGHRDRAVVQQLERDVDAGRHRGADRERTGVEERAVAEVLDEVLALEERRHADPLRTLVAHAREADEIADALGLHQADHRVAADAAAHERAGLGPGADVVRAAAAEERRPLDRERDERPVADRRGERRETVVEACREPGPQWLDQALGVEHPAGGDQRMALVVASPDDRGSLVGVVERVAHEPLEGRVLLLHDDDLGETAGELAHLRRLERHGHQQLEQPDAGGADRVVVAESEHVRASRGPRRTSCRTRRCRSSRGRRAR